MGTQVAGDAGTTCLDAGAALCAIRREMLSVHFGWREHGRLRGWRGTDDFDRVLCMVMRSGRLRVGRRGADRRTLRSMLSNSGITQRIW